LREKRFEMDAARVSRMRSGESTPESAKKQRLHHRADVLPEAALLGDARGVDDVQAQLARDGPRGARRGETTPRRGPTGR
jgi:hypothetical protein